MVPFAILNLISGIYAGRCVILFPATVIYFVKCAVLRMAASQDAKDDGGEGDTDHSEAKKLPDKPSAKAKEILAGGYTKGLIRSHLAFAQVILESKSFPAIDRTLSIRGFI